MNPEDGRRELVVYPDPGLSTKCRLIDEVDDEVRGVVAEMFEIMYENRGVGLAGPQAGVDWRVVIINMAADPGSGEELVMLNPVIREVDGEEIAEEGCLRNFFRIHPPPECSPLIIILLKHCHLGMKNM